MTRYALYFAPEPATALHRFGWAWLGRDPASPTLLPPLWSDAGPWIAEPRLYGFHATLKPPFHLAEGYSRDDLLAALRAFATDHPSFVTAPLSLQVLDGFLALRPSAPASRLDRLAADCVTAFDPFRAPLSEAELARRLAAPLSERQVEQLCRWGYPYVFEDFRFHMTLTSRMPPADRKAVEELLHPLLRRVVDEPLAVSAVCLFEQEAEQPFVLAERVALTRG